jgi:hypothetical protein
MPDGPSRPSRDDSRTPQAIRAGALAWPETLPLSVRNRARLVAGQIDAGVSEKALAKRLGLSIRRIHELLLIGDMLAFSNSGQLSPRLTAMRDIVQAAIDAQKESRG